MPNLQTQYQQNNPYKPTNPYAGSNYADNMGMLGYYGESNLRGDNPSMSVLGHSIMPGYAQRVMDQLAFSNGIMGQGQNAIMAALRNMTPAARQARLDAFRRRAQSNARKTAMSGDMTLRGLGISSGGRAGAVDDAYNQANRQVNDYDAQLNSPEGQMSGALNMLGLIGEGSQIDLPQLLQIISLLENNSQFRKQTAGSGSIFGGIGELAGLAMGGGGFNIGSLFKKQQSPGPNYSPLPTP